MNERLKRAGYFTAREFNRRLQDWMKDESEKKGGSEKGA